MTGSLPLFKPGRRVSRTRLPRIPSIGRHAESVISESPSAPHAEALQQGIKRLPLRGPKVALTATFQVMPQPVLDVPVHRCEHPAGMAMAEVIPSPENSRLLFHGLCRLGKIDWASESHQELDRCLSRTITASKNFND